MCGCRVIAILDNYLVNRRGVGSQMLTSSNELSESESKHHNSEQLLIFKRLKYNTIRKR